MQKIYTDQTLLMVTHMKNLLEVAHINSELRNEFLAGGVGELSFIDAWPELWVAYEDVAGAKQLIAADLESSKGNDWQCTCGEANGAAFSSCWACQLDRPLSSEG
jgi:hypothetical protein